MKKIPLLFVFCFCCLQIFGKSAVCIVDECFPHVQLTNDSSLWYELKEALISLGYGFRWTGSLTKTGECQLIICFKPPSWEVSQRLHPKEKLILFLWEPEVGCPETYDKRYHDYFSRIYTWKDSLVDNRRYFKFCYPLQLNMIENIVPFDEKKLAAMINCNKDSTHTLSLYGERRKVIHFFEKNHSDDFDLYGRGWPANLKNYRGTVESKVECLKQYKFCFAYENMRDVDGYITEKIFDTFEAGCVPIYWGAKNIENYIPKNCFIDRRDFESNEELYNFLKNMSQKEHQRYVDNIRKFLKTAQALTFSYANFIDAILSAVEPGYDRNVALREEHRADLEKLDDYRRIPIIEWNKDCYLVLHNEAFIRKKPRYKRREMLCENYR